MFKVVLEKFEGPLDLLLELIERNEMDITQLSLAKVADDYLDYIRSSSDISLENISDFINVASKIILVKSQAILPSFEVTQEEKEEIVNLEEQLRVYKIYKDAAKKISLLFLHGAECFSRAYMQGIEAHFSFPDNLKVYDLAKSFRRIIKEIPEMDNLPQEHVQETVTLEQKMRGLIESIRERSEQSFLNYAQSASDKIEIIVSFLALLELIKRKVVWVEQSALFSDIKIKKAA